MSISNLLFLFIGKPINQVLSKTKFNEYDRHESGFTTYYLKHILPLHETLENNRILTLTKLGKHCRLSLPISLLSSFILMIF